MVAFRASKPASNTSDGAQAIFAGLDLQYLGAHHRHAERVVGLGDPGLELGDLPSYGDWQCAKSCAAP